MKVMFWDRLVVNAELTNVTILIGNCNNNKTVIEQCGEGNTCSGTLDNFMCICEGHGYRTDDANNQMCAESKEIFYLSYEKL